MGTNAMSDAFMPKLLSAGHANYDCRNVFRINEGVEIFRASEVRKMDNAVGNLRDFASELFSRSQVQLDSFAGAALKDAQHARIRLQGGLFLSEQTGTGNRRNNQSEKRVTFHDQCSA
jgi:hypothetical protein